MNLEEEPVKEIMNRFKWVSDTTIRLVNKEGIEKLLDLLPNGTCKSREYNMIPIFDAEECKESTRSYFGNRKPLNVV